MSCNRTLTVLPDEADMLRQMLVEEDAVTMQNFRNSVIHGDAFRLLEILPDEMADLIVLDPPYNLRRTFGTYQFKTTTAKGYESYLRSWFSTLCKKLKPTGSLYFCGDWTMASVLQNLMQEELTVINRITWKREKGRGAMSNWKNCMEDIWFGVKDKKHYTFNAHDVMTRHPVRAPYRVNGKPKDWDDTSEGKFRKTYPSNLMDDLSVPFWSMPENTEHPTQKPEKLLARIILASSNEGDMVFDPFLGSGTTAVVAKKLGRQFCGIEQDENYCLLAQKRLLRACEDASIQGYENGLFIGK